MCLLIGTVPMVSDVAYGPLVSRLPSLHISINGKNEYIWINGKKIKMISYVKFNSQSMFDIDTYTLY